MATLLVSDHEREYTVDLLRGHLLSGRLTADDFEARVDEAWHARDAQDLWQALRFLPVERPAPPALREAAGGGGGSGTASAALVMGLVALCMMVFTLGFAFPIALPVGGVAWMLGRDARRSGPERVRGIARAGEAIGIVATVWAMLMLAGCAAIVT